MGHVEKYQDVQYWLGKGWTLGQQGEVVPVKPQSERDRDWLGQIGVLEIMMASLDYTAFTGIF